MFEKFTKKIAEKMGQSVKESVEPIKQQMSRKVNNKVDLYSKIARLGVLVILFVEGTRRVSNEVQKDHSPPQQIVINNYLCGRESEEKK